MGQVMGSLAQGNLPSGDCCKFGRWEVKKVLAMYRRYHLSRADNARLRIENAALRARLRIESAAPRAQLG